jgi:phosphatidylethanolamine/phosphatidyl-N-methylethanolamine N-methyltransferase
LPVTTFYIRICDIMENSQNSIKSYIKNLLKDPNVASIAPTSATGIDCILKNVHFCDSYLIVEYGPGGGVITQYILDNIPPDCLLLAIETNQEFAENLAKEIRDSRLIIKNGSAENIESYIQELYNEGRIPSPKAQYIVSGIPFSLFPLALKNRILKATRNSLDPKGAFLVYQFLLSIPSRKHDIKAKLKEFFKIERSEWALKNLPPLRIYEAVLKDS